jgi:hypothetical protein
VFLRIRSKAIKQLVGGLSEPGFSSKRFQQDGNYWRKLKSGSDQRLYITLTVEGVILKRKSLQSERGVPGTAVSDHTA